MNPFEFDSKEVEDYVMHWKRMYPKAYKKKDTAPYTKTRVILLNGCEFEQQWFLHQFARHCTDPELKKEIAYIRNQEQQQQKRISCLKPINENILETTIAYEQLAIDLTAILAQNEKDKNNKAALDFALLEDFDHLYRFANLLKMDYGIEAGNLVGEYTEIMPGRPTIAEHRNPRQNTKSHINNKKADPYTKCVGMIITAAEQQTMNFYMNMAQMYKNDYGRKLFAEIAMVEEEHVTQYESLNDPNGSWLEHWLMHEYVECYLYYSAMEDESDTYIKGIWKEHFEMEVAHLKRVAKLLEKYEKKKVSDVIPDAEFPKLISFKGNKEYIRSVLEHVSLTQINDKFVEVNTLKEDSDYVVYQNKVNKNLVDVPSHMVIEKAIDKFGKDYRHTDKKHVIKTLEDRKHDNTNAGRDNRYLIC